VRLKITTDGTPRNTKVVDTETGKSLGERCTRILIDMTPDRARAEVTFMLAGDDFIFDGVFDVYKTRDPDLEVGL
jgi:hypothetical protein